ncbi:hypothetical protein EXIGLDRAFT_516931 [Exidia glandulosa HHB12029]|uniref:F-box domain-containing protein n=1 Tax=Exidia glandulosa HHB12029 TaxID=1314781 RepID=A0A165J7R3_EXIGL|nr:hypothetical protein EXIGLDRAFT_516931 [Exidia glandulosa HHB12029]
MSCCVCRLPFLPHRKYARQPLQAHLPPLGLFSESQKAYFERGLGFGEFIYAIYLDFIYLSDNYFAVENVNPKMPVLLQLVWELPAGDVACPVMHHTCMNLFRRIFDAEENTYDNLKKLARFQYAIGRPQGGKDAGRWRNVQYEMVEPKVDTRALWSPSYQRLGGMVFDWKALKGLGYEWLMQRPDVFPRFFTKVSPERMKHLAATAAGNDILSRQPPDVLRHIARFLDVRSLTRVSATCRYLRFLALSDWQAVARKAVFGLGWATPTLSEYAESKDSGLASISATSEGDWLLYLGHVHRTKGMRVRRWIWGLCEEIKRVADANIVTCGVLDEGSPDWAVVEKWFEEKWGLCQLYHGLGDGGGQTIRMDSQAHFEEDVMKAHVQAGHESVSTQQVIVPPAVDRVVHNDVASFRRDLARQGVYSES